MFPYVFPLIFFKNIFSVSPSPSPLYITSQPSAAKVSTPSSPFPFYSTRPCPTITLPFISFSPTAPWPQSTFLPTTVQFPMENKALEKAGASP